MFQQGGRQFSVEGQASLSVSNPLESITSELPIKTSTLSSALTTALDDYSLEMNNDFSYQRSVCIDYGSSLLDQEINSTQNFLTVDLNYDVSDYKSRLRRLLDCSNTLKTKILAKSKIEIQHSKHKQVSEANQIEFETKLEDTDLIALQEKIKKYLDELIEMEVVSHEDRLFYKSTLQSGLRIIQNLCQTALEDIKDDLNSQIEIPEAKKSIQEHLKEAAVSQLEKEKEKANGLVLEDAKTRIFGSEDSAEGLADEEEDEFTLVGALHEKMTSTPEAETKDTDEVVDTGKTEAADDIGETEAVTKITAGPAKQEAIDWSTVKMSVSGDKTWSKSKKKCFFNYLYFRKQLLN